MIPRQRHRSEHSTLKDATDQPTKPDLSIPKATTPSTMRNKENSQASASFNNHLSKKRSETVLQLNSNLSNHNSLATPHQTTSSKVFLYEPAMVSTKLIRQWENLTGAKWYDLSPDVRHKMNLSLKGKGLIESVQIFKQTDYYQNMVMP